MAYCFLIYIFGPAQHQAHRMHSMYAPGRTDTWMSLEDPMTTAVRKHIMQLWVDSRASAIKAEIIFHLILYHCVWNILTVQDIFFRKSEVEDAVKEIKFP